MPKIEKKVYADGIRFECTACGECCKSRGGYDYVYVNLKERRRLARHLRLDTRAFTRHPVNIHEVLDRVRKVAESGFARGVSIVEAFDPSLPPVLGDRDQLIQVFLNLVRNAADALPEKGGEITLTTGYRPGVKFGAGVAGERVSLPLEVTVRDNGSGVPIDLLPYIFDPFVTTKVRGSGLGLALVAKIVGDHGGVVECDSVSGRTIFRVLLPQARGGES